VNINTAPAIVLASLSELMTDELAESIAAYRSETDDEGEGQYFKSAQDLKNVTGMTDEILSSIAPYVTTRSFFFNITTRAISGRISRSVYYLVRRDLKEDQSTATTKLIYWQNTRDYLRLEDPQQNTQE